MKNFISFLILLLGIWLLWVGNWNQLSLGFHDVNIYECFAKDFWFGKGCELIGHPQDGVPFKVLPNEYPPLSLLIFSLPLLFPGLPYYILFGILMTVPIIITYYYLAKSGGRKMAVRFMIYLLLGGYSLAISRFDIVPSTLTFFVLISALKKRFILSYLLLALSTMLKLYPIFLLLPLFIYQQQAIKKTKLLARLKGLIIFCLSCLVIVSISIFLNPERLGTYISYYLNRPLEVESLPASVLAFVSQSQNLCTASAFGSINLYEKMDGLCLSVIGPTSRMLIDITLTLQLAFILVILFWQWKKKPHLNLVFIATLLTILLTSKVFSPQFVIWLIPFIAYERVSLMKRVYWGVALAFTTYTFLFKHPFNLPTFLFFTTVKNSFFVLAWLFYLGRGYFRR